MYVYIMKCANYYKIGYSKNPESRRKTIQTHNPFKVRICAVKKTELYLEIEKELHNRFYSSKTNGEWFELNFEDLQSLKVDYNFNFKIPLHSINNDIGFDNSNKQIISKLYRFDNSQREQLISKFESLFSCKIKSLRTFNYCFVNYDHDVIDASIHDLFNKEYEPEEAYNKLKTFCKHAQNRKDDPVNYMNNILVSIFSSYYNHTLAFNEELHFEDILKDVSDPVDFVKYIHTNKFYCEDSYDFILKIEKYISTNRKVKA